jgi:hypothetical protein
MLSRDCRGRVLITLRSCLSRISKSMVADLWLGLFIVQVNIARQMHFNFTTPDYERQKTIGLCTPKRHRDFYLR